MTKLHKSLFILALAIPLASANLSWAAMNTKPTPGSGTGEGEATCLKWCQDNNKTSGRVSKCAVQCEVYWCRDRQWRPPDEPATTIQPSQVVVLAPARRTLCRPKSRLRGRLGNSVKRWQGLYRGSDWIWKTGSRKIFRTAAHRERDNECIIQKLKC